MSNQVNDPQIRISRTEHLSIHSTSPPLLYDKFTLQGIFLLLVFIYGSWEGPWLVHLDHVPRPWATGLGKCWLVRPGSHRWKRLWLASCPEPRGTGKGSSAGRWARGSRIARVRKWPGSQKQQTASTNGTSLPPRWNTSPLAWHTRAFTVWPCFPPLTHLFGLCPLMVQNNPQFLEDALLSVSPLNLDWKCSLPVSLPKLCFILLWCDLLRESPAWYSGCHELHASVSHCRQPVCTGV